MQWSATPSCVGSATSTPAERWLPAGVQFKDLPPETVARINAYIRDKDVPFYDEGF